MNKKNYLLSAVLCSSLCVAGVLSGCNGGGNGVDPAPTKGSVTTPVAFGAADKLQFTYSSYAEGGAFSNQTITRDAGSSANTSVAPVAGNFPPAVFSDVVSVLEASGTVSSFPGGGNVTVGNIGVTTNDQGGLSLSGTLSPAGGTLASTAISAAAGPAVYTAVTPDKNFAYQISSVQVVPQSLNITNPPLTTLDQTTINATAANVQVNATSAVNTLTSSVTSLGAFGSNRLTTMRIDPVTGALDQPPFQLNISNLGLSGTLNYAVVHPSGSYLYVFGDELSVQASGTNANVAEVAGPTNDTINYRFDTSGAPNFITPGNATTPPAVNFVPTLVSSGRTVGRRGFVYKFNINRSTGEPDTINFEFTRLPAGFATTKHAVFGPNGGDLYLGCYNVANGGDRRVNAGAVLHYKLSTAGSTITGSLPAAPTGQFALPRGTHSLAFSQGYKRLYASCQFGEATFANGSATPNSGQPTGGSGSVRCFTVDPNNGGLARQASGDLLGLTFPGAIVPHPTFDRLYVAESGNLPYVGGDVTGSLGAGAAIACVGVNSQSGVLSVLSREVYSVIGSRQLNSLAIDPNGLVLYAQGNAQTPSIVAGLQFPAFPGDTGKISIHNIRNDGSTVHNADTILAGSGRLGEVYKLANRP